jgi:hypothetical protein
MWPWDSNAQGSYSILSIVIEARGRRAAGLEGRSSSSRTMMSAGIGVVQEMTDRRGRNGGRERGELGRFRSESGRC